MPACHLEAAASKLPHRASKSIVACVAGVDYSGTEFAHKSRHLFLSKILRSSAAVAVILGKFSIFPDIDCGRFVARLSLFECLPHDFVGGCRHRRTAAELLSMVRQRLAENPERSHRPHE